MPLKVFENGKALTSDIIRAISFAKENGAAIVNCSWGASEYNAALKQVMYESGLIFICAAGNSGSDLEEKPIYPACYDIDNIINVVSVNDDFGLCGFSNYGTVSADVAAKGRDIYKYIHG